MFGRQDRIRSRHIKHIYCGLDAEVYPVARDPDLIYICVAKRKAIWPVKMPPNKSPNTTPASDKTTQSAPGTTHSIATKYAPIHHLRCLQIGVTNGHHWQWQISFYKIQVCRYYGCKKGGACEHSKRTSKFR